jgi:hypothetical protein
MGYSMYSYIYIYKYLFVFVPYLWMSRLKNIYFYITLTKSMLVSLDLNTNLYLIPCSDIKPSKWINSLLNNYVIYLLYICITIIYMYIFLFSMALPAHSGP